MTQGVSGVFPGLAVMQNPAGNQIPKRHQPSSERTQTSGLPVSGQLLVHRSEDKLTFYQASPALTWSEELVCWTTTDSDLMLSILRDRRFEAVNFEREARRLEDAIGFDLSAIRSLVDCLPLGNEGMRHAETRQDAAVFLKRRAAEAGVVFRDTFAARFGAAMASRAKFDLVADVLTPSIDRLFEALTGVRTERSEGDLPLSSIFDPVQSINRRKRLEQQVRSAIAAQVHACPAGPEHGTLAVALTAVGADSLAASLAESFIFAAKSNEGRRLCDIAWGDRPPRTGIPYVDRIVSEALDFGAVQLLAGQRVRLYLDALQLHGAAGYDHYFGAGRHVCLGKPISLEAWRTMTSILARFQECVTVGLIRYRKSDFLLNAPETVGVTAQID